MRFIAIVLAFSSVSAFAATCPNLAGKYASCRSTTGAASGSTDMVITQKTVNGVTTYTATSTDDETQERESTEMIADGKSRTETQEDPNMGTVTTTTVYTCSVVKIVGNQTVSIQGQDIVSIDQEIQKKGNTLEIDMNGQLFGQSIQDTIICE